MCEDFLGRQLLKGISKAPIGPNSCNQTMNQSFEEHSSDGGVLCHIARPR